MMDVFFGCGPRRVRSIKIPKTIGHNPSNIHGTRSGPLRFRFAEIRNHDLQKTRCRKVLEFLASGVACNCRRFEITDMLSTSFAYCAVSI